jgi:hypothetical protein
VGRAVSSRTVLAGLVLGATTTSLLWWTGRANLAGPPLLRPGDIPAWWAAVGPPAAVFGTLRLALLAMSAGCCAGSVSMLTLRALISCAGWLALRAHRMGLRGLARVALGLTTSGGLLAAAGCGGPVRAAPRAPVLVGEGPPAGSFHLDPVPRPAAATPVTPPPAQAARAPTRRATPKVRTWTIRPGDDFWSIAETVVSGSPAGRPDPRAVAPYWSRLVAANRDRLPAPDHPNLLFPGDVVIIPPLASGNA